MSQCVQVVLSFKLNDLGNNEDRLFLPGERYEFTSDPISLPRGCGCGDGSIVMSTFYDVTIGPNNRVYRLPGEFLIAVNCESPNEDGVQPLLTDRLSSIGNPPIDPVTNTVMDVQSTNVRNDDAVLARFNKMATFDLRKRK